MTTMEQSVLDGVAILDEMRPGWARSIDTRTLDLAYGDECILGQLYGSYREGLRLLCGRRYEDDWALEHGFVVDARSTSPHSVRDACLPLTEAWLRIVEERQLPDWEPSQTQGSQHARI